jgi:hypothetical protein
VTILNDPKFFPSRLSVDSKPARQHLVQCARRLYRVFAHAYHHHESEFRAVEEDRCLCSRFLHLIKVFNIVPEKHLQREAQIPSTALHFPQPKRSSKRPLHPSMQISFKADELMKASEGNLKAVLEEGNADE